MEVYDALAQDYVLAFGRDEAALARLNRHYERDFTFDDLWGEIWRRDYAFRQRSSRVPANYLPLEEARLILAQDTGFGSWDALGDAVRTGARPLPPFSIDAKENRINPQRTLTDRRVGPADRRDERAWHHRPRRRRADDRRRPGAGCGARSRDVARRSAARGSSQTRGCTTWHACRSWSGSISARIPAAASPIAAWKCSVIFRTFAISR